MKTAKAKKERSIPFIIGIIDCILCLLAMSVGKWKLFSACSDFFANIKAEFLFLFLAWLLVLCITLSLAFSLKKSYGACIAMIAWGFLHHSFYPCF